ncbi:RNA polymerase sigma factor [Aestuariimicrobium soli]|uniref:RNA polymerase sigma factor n=1 Tax=Aestuariimicrobium soli TaxID=2035834 RepID=UPI003EBF330F
MTTDADTALTRAHRDEWARLVASLTRRFGSLDVAEEATAEAFAVAAEHWRAHGVPPNPGGWLSTTASRKALDRLRRDQVGRRKLQEAAMLDEQLADEPPPDPTGEGTLDLATDDRLRLVFTCAHPALSMEARVALTLRLLGGLTVPEIASAFLVPDTTMGQRITRAKRKIAAAGIPYRVPSATDLPERLDGVLAVLYLVFNEGYLSSSPTAAPIRVDLTGEAIRLTGLLHALMPDEGEVAGLLALMLLIEARREARVDSSGVLLRLDEQDRDRWDRDLIARGQGLVRARIATGVAPGRYQLMAAINAVHTHARRAPDTDWSQIVVLYGQLMRLDPSPIVALNRAVAVAEVDGPQVGLALVDRLGDALDGYHPFHVARADLLSRLGRPDEAGAAYDRALALATNTAEIAHLTRRRAELG